MVSYPGQNVGRGLLIPLEVSITGTQPWSPLGGQGRFSRVVAIRRMLDLRIERVSCRMTDGSPMPITVLQAEIQRTRPLHGKDITFIRWLSTDMATNPGHTHLNMAITIVDMTGSVKTEVTSCRPLKLFGESRKLVKFQPPPRLRDLRALLRPRTHINRVQGPPTLHAMWTGPSHQAASATMRTVPC